MDKLGKKIKKTRKEKGLTLVELAKGAGCSTSFISELERGKVSPSIATLKRIASSLGMTIADCFTDDGEDADPVVTRENERTKMTMKGWKANINLLVSGTKDKIMQPFYTVVEPGGGSLESYNHEGEEFGFVAKGELDLNINGKSYKVKKNESFYFSSRVPHSWVNNSRKKTVVFWVVSPPTW